MAQSIVSLKGFFTFISVTALLWDVASFPLVFLPLLPLKLWELKQFDI
jgi:hypothetical protein